MVRENTGNQYIFIHFLTPSNIVLDDSVISISVGSCILYDKFSFQKIYQDNCELIHDWFHVEGNMENIIERYGFECNKIYTVSDSSKITKIIQSMEKELGVAKKISVEHKN